MNLTGKKVVWIGNSHSEALDSQMMPWLLSKGAADVAWVARRGWSLARYLREDFAQLISRADVVFVELGGNPPATTVSELREVLRLTAGKQLIWIGPPYSLRPDIQEVHDASARAQKLVLPIWVDSRPMTRTGHRDDGVHFTIPAGYARWAKQIQRALEPSKLLTAALLFGVVLGGAWLVKKI